MTSVLLVDDETEAAEALKAFLDMQDIPCWLAADGDQALKAIAEHKPDLILLDVKLEGSRLSGFEVLEAARKLLPSAKIFMLSGYHDEAFHTKAKELGAADYLEKPLTSEKVLEVIKQVGS